MNLFPVYKLTPKGSAEEALGRLRENTVGFDVLGVMDQYFQGEVFNDCFSVTKNNKFDERFMFLRFNYFLFAFSPVFNGKVLGDEKIEVSVRVSKLAIILITISSSFLFYEMLTEEISSFLVMIPIVLVLILVILAFSILAFNAVRDEMIGELKKTLEG